MLQDVVYNICYMKRLINKMRTRKFVLEMANDMCSLDKLPDKTVDSTGREWNYSRCNTGLKRFNSVSQDFIDILDAEFRKLIVDKLKTNPPRGKTVK